jgi:hypothetical protein
LDPGLVRAEILAMMGTFEESNRIINDIKGRREPKLPGSKRQYNKFWYDVNDLYTCGVVLLVILS